MRFRVEALMRILLGGSVGAFAAIRVLLYGDYSEPAVSPSHLYQLGNNVWAAGIVWWALAGFVTGIIGGLASVRSPNNASQLAFASIPVGVVITTGYLVFQLWQMTDRTLGSFAVLFGINTLFYAFVALFPALFGALLGMMLVSYRKRRSINEIMPDELGKELAERKAQKARR